MLHSSMRFLLPVTLLCVWSRQASAGGYDTPMLYSARHMGMGGTAIGYVRDPSALFHNPAGLGHVSRVSVLGDFSLLIGGIHGSPTNTARDLDSETTVAPFFLVGSGFRITDFLVLGLGLYPVASSGATYRYGDDFENTTTLLFVEASPAAAVNLTRDVRLGVGYRVTYVRLERFQGVRDSAAPYLDLSLVGHDFGGWRAGAQWTVTPYLELGVAYRHVTETEVSADAGIALFEKVRDVSTHFTLPSKLGAGARLDWKDFGSLPLSTALDVEYTFNSQNEGDPLEVTRAVSGQQTSVPNVFEWSDSVTLRLGFEYALHPDDNARWRKLLLRAGYVFDAKTANESYPTAFGTPPAHTQVLTAGVGYSTGSFKTNVAYGYRFGSGEVTEEDLSAPGREPCAFCGAAGDYRITLNGFYVDASYEY
ncbi:MAG TPA: outer membrane protein transport protein [Polyangiaceae bacterium]